MPKSQSNSEATVTLESGDNNVICVACEPKILDAKQCKVIMFIVLGSLATLAVLASIVFAIYHFEIRKEDD